MSERNSRPTTITAAKWETIVDDVFDKKVTVTFGDVEVLDVMPHDVEFVILSVYSERMGFDKVKVRSSEVLGMRWLTATDAPASPPAPGSGADIEMIDVMNDRGVPQRAVWINIDGIETMFIHANDVTIVERDRESYKVQCNKAEDERDGLQRLLAAAESTLEILWNASEDRWSAIAKVLDQPGEVLAVNIIRAVEQQKRQIAALKTQLAEARAEVARLREALRDTIDVSHRLLLNHAAMVNHNFPGGLRPLPLPDEEVTFDLRLQVIEILNKADDICDGTHSPPAVAALVAACEPFMETWQRWLDSDDYTSNEEPFIDWLQATCDSELLQANWQQLAKAAALAKVKGE